MGFFRGLMVPISFVLFLAVFGAVAVAVVAAGPLSTGLKPEDLPTLLPKGAGVPNPFVIAAGLALVADLFIGMIAMLVSERVTGVWGFLKGVLKTSLWFAVIFAGGLAVYLNGTGEDPMRFLPAGLLAGGLVAAAIVTSILLGLPFVWWVSERPPVKRAKRTLPPLPPIPPPPQPVAEELTPAELPRETRPPQDPPRPAETLPAGGPPPAAV